MGGDSLFPAQRTDLFVGGCFDANLVFGQVEEGGKVAADGVNVWTDFWPLGDQRDVHIGE